MTLIESTTGLSARLKFPNGDVTTVEVPPAPPSDDPAVMGYRLAAGIARELGGAFTLRLAVDGVEARVFLAPSPSRTNSCMRDSYSALMQIAEAAPALGGVAAAILPDGTEAGLEIAAGGSAPQTAISLAEASGSVYELPAGLSRQVTRLRETL